MKIPLEWLKEYVTVSKDARAVADSFTAIGLMLDKPISTYTNDKYVTEVLDLEHRMDRADWLSILGCARDYAAYQGLKLRYPKHNVRSAKTPAKTDIVDIKVMCPDLVCRFNTRVLKNIKVKPSPTWLKNRLEAYGIPSINNVVDVTNYVMVELGQPMHAQDISKMRKREIVIRRAIKGEKMVTLLGETVNLDNDCFVLTQDNIPTVLGGIVGGQETAIDETTTDIILDAGNYNQNNIRKTSRRLKIQNETVLRYDKFLHPELTEHAIDRAAALILELAGGSYYFNIDWYPKKTAAKSMILRYARLTKLSGMGISSITVKRILTSLGYDIKKITTKDVTVAVPHFRTDVEVEDDVVADILRINGYGNIPSAQISASPPKEITPNIYIFENRLKDILTRVGLHEHITDPLVAYDKNNIRQVLLENSQSSEKNALRTGMYPTLSTVTQIYKKAGLREIGLFELGNAYFKNNANTDDYASYEEKRMVCTVFQSEALDRVQLLSKVKSCLRSILVEVGMADYKVTHGKDGYTIVINGIEAGNIRHDGFSLYTQVLLKEQSRNLRVTAGQILHRSDDLSIKTPVGYELGNVYQFIKGFSKDFVDVVTKVENRDIKDKYVLFTIKHMLDSFASIRSQLVKELKARFGDIEIR